MLYDTVGSPPSPSALAPVACGVYSGCQPATAHASMASHAAGVLDTRAHAATCCRARVRGWRQRFAPQSPDHVCRVAPDPGDLVRRSHHPSASVLACTLSCATRWRDSCDICRRHPVAAQPEPRERRLRERPITGQVVSDLRGAFRVKVHSCERHAEVYGVSNGQCGHGERWRGAGVASPLRGPWTGREASRSRTAWGSGCKPLCERWE